MKKLALVLSILMVTPLVAMADQEKVNYYTPYYNQGNIVQGKKVQYAEKNSKVYKRSSGNDYILKYNIDDLESAPWINGGKRNYN
jgi:hypothetical protein